MEEFETQIAYFFGVADKTPVVSAYVEALKKLEEIGVDAPILLLEKALLPHLETAYREISRQRNLNFDVHQAAKLELKMILGNATGASFETVQEIQTRLYTLVFQSDHPLIKKAALLRTFLYQYKVHVLKTEGKIAPSDQRLLLSIAKTSENYLNGPK